MMTDTEREIAPPEPGAHGHSRTPALAAIVGEDPGLRAVLARAARVARTRTPVLVTGESGTGKELLARAIHELGPTPAGPFVAVNCGALPRELAESELFGHERGAFTGAGGRRIGWFEEAHGGTLVLDEVGELPLGLQPKLLRVLDTGRLRRVGGRGEVPVDVRVVAMTLRDLPEEIARGDFRVDLYHRLAGFELALPPLRRRPGDIPLLCRHFLDEMAGEIGRRALGAEVLARLSAYHWPGNVRELRNVLRRAAILGGERIEVGALGLPEWTLKVGGAEVGGAEVREEAAPAALSSLSGGGEQPCRLADADDLPRSPTPSPSNDNIRTAGDGDLLPLRGRTFQEIERAVLAWALAGSGGSRRRAARSLAMARSTFCDKVKRYGLG